MTDNGAAVVAPLGDGGAFIPAFPVRPDGPGGLAGAVFRWAGRAGVEMDAPDSTVESYRAVVRLVQDHLGPHHPSYRRVVGSVCAEMVLDVGGFDPLVDGPVVRRTALRWVAAFPALWVVRALVVALTNPQLVDAGAVLAYAAAVLRRWART